MSKLQKEKGKQETKEQRWMGKEALEAYRKQLLREEKSPSTIKKYLCDIEKFSQYLQDNWQEAEVSKEKVMAYKEFLQMHYAIRSVNSYLVALNRFFEYLGWYDCKIKLCKLQREIFCQEEEELKKEEYLRLIYMAQTLKKSDLVW